MAVGPRFSLHHSALVHFSFYWETTPDETILEARNVCGNSNTTNQWHDWLNKDHVRHAFIFSRFLLDRPPNDDMKFSNLSFIPTKWKGTTWNNHRTLHKEPAGLLQTARFIGPEEPIRKQWINYFFFQVVVKCSSLRTIKSFKSFIN